MPTQSDAEFEKDANEIGRAIQEATFALGNTRSIGDFALQDILSLVTKVVQVIEQAFQDIYVTLVRIGQLKPADLGTSKVDTLRNELALLNARSFYNQSEEICSRLKHLRIYGEETILNEVPDLRNNPEWWKLFNIFEEREGYFLRFVEGSFSKLREMLDHAVTSQELDNVARLAARQSKVLRRTLKDLRTFKDQILGISGKQGLLELVAKDRKKLESRISVMIDKSTTHGPRVHFGDNTVFHGDFVAATNIIESFSKQANGPGTAELKRKLTELSQLVEQLSKQLPTAKAAEVARDFKTLVDESTSSSPRKKWYELSSENLIDAAKTCAALAAPVAATVTEIVRLLSSGS